MKLTQLQRKRIIEYMNPVDHNRRDVNWIKPLNKVEDGYNIEIGYWIYYLDLSPTYNKEIVYFTVSKLNKFNNI